MLNKIKVGVIIVDDKGNILLLKEKIKKNTIPLWNIVKGTYGDNSPETIFDAAIREAKEESSVEIKLTGLLGVFVSTQTDGTWVQFTYIAKIINGEPTIADVGQQLERDEKIEELKWFSRQEIIAMSEDQFISKRIYDIISDYLAGKEYPLRAVRNI